MKGFNGSRMYGNSVNAPSDFGVQSFMWIPFGTYRNAARSGDFATGAAAATGAIASSHGSATAAPSPLSMVRRSMVRAMKSGLLRNRDKGWTVRGRQAGQAAG